MANIIYQDDDTGKYIAGIDPYYVETDESSRPEEYTRRKARRKGFNLTPPFILNEDESGLSPGVGGKELTITMDKAWQGDDDKLRAILRDTSEAADEVLVLKVRRKGRASAADLVLADIREPLNEQEQIEFDKAVKECAENFFSVGSDYDIDKFYTKDEQQEEQAPLTTARMKELVKAIYNEISIEPETIPLPLTIQSL